MKSEIEMHETVSVKFNNYWVSILVCGLAATFYLYEFILQVSPSVMTDFLMHDLHTTAAGLGVISACYFYSYAPMQIPAGLLYDKFGPRLLITIAIVICAVGAFFFGLTNSAILAAVGRFFMGIGSAFAFIGVLLLISRWFPLKYFAFLAGVAQFMSSIGAIAGEAPLSSATQHFGWHQTMLFISFGGFLLALLTWLFIRNFPTHSSAKINPTATTEISTWQRLSKVLHNQQNRYVALYAFCVWAPITAFAALWGVPFLVAEYGVSTTQASEACAMIWLGIGIGSPFIGWLSDKIANRCALLTTCAFIGAIALFIIIYAPDMPFWLMYCWLFLFGIAASAQALSFAMVKDNNSPDVVATAIGFNNMAVVLGGAIFQPLTGVLLKLYWHPGTLHGASTYTVSDYRIALFALPLCYVVGFMISKFLLQETHCREVYCSASATSL